MNPFEKWIIKRKLHSFLKENPGMSDFMTMLLSTDSLWGRIIRAVILAIIGGSTDGTTLPGDLHVPSWAIAVLAALAGLIPAGQMNPK